MLRQRGLGVDHPRFVFKHAQQTCLGVRQFPLLPPLVDPRSGARQSSRVCILAFFRIVGILVKTFDRGGERIFSGIDRQLVERWPMQVIAFKTITARGRHSPCRGRKATVWRFLKSSCAVSEESCPRLEKLSSPLGRTSTVPSGPLNSRSGRLPKASAASAVISVTPAKLNPFTLPSVSASSAESSFCSLGRLKRGNCSTPHLALRLLVLRSQC